MEFVLSLTGATGGSLIAYVWPSMIHKFTKTGNEQKKDLFLNVTLINNLDFFFKQSLKDISLNWYCNFLHMFNCHFFRVRAY